MTGLQAQLREAGDAATAAELAPLLNFIDETQRNLDLARPAANAIRAPIVLEVTEGAEGREPLSAFGFAAALLVSLGLAGVLLAAAAMASEREDGALVRLRRGLISAGALVGEKMAFTACACLVVGLALLGGVALFTDLAVGRWGLWLGVLLLAGLAFGAFGVLAGALARETRSALLIALMVALPLMALGLVPDSGAASAISEVVPFGPAFDAFQTLLVEPSIDGGELLLTLGQLALIALAAAAAVAGAAAARGLDEGPRPHVEGVGEPPPVLLRREREGAEAEGVRRRHLDVPEREAGLPEQPGRAHQRGAPRRGPVEHRLGGEEAAERDAEEPARQAVAVPGLDAVRPPGPVEPHVRRHQARREPRPAGARAGTGRGDLGEGPVHADGVSPRPQRPPHGARDPETLDRQHPAGVAGVEPHRPAGAHLVHREPPRRTRRGAPPARAR